ncbi:MAG: ATP-dependent DNA helicase RecG [Clostridiales bacterium]|jgi:ATP-dependent DNA helicase RecG|nr:ATP-dependent DNA helicase RecG [Clostridiales bacterium]
MKEFCGFRQNSPSKEFCGFEAFPLSLDDSVAALPGVGEKRRAALSAAGIETVRDLLTRSPRRYEDHSLVTPISGLSPGDSATVAARPHGAAAIRRSGARSVVSCPVSDGTGTLTLRWFNQHYMRSRLSDGVTYRFSGRVSEFAGKLFMDSPEIGAEDDDGVAPVYTAVAGIPKKTLTSFVRSALEALGDVPDPLPPADRDRLGLVSFRDALWGVHFPESREAFFCSRKRLAFDELLRTRLALGRVKSAARVPAAFVAKDTDLSPLLSRLPYTPTSAQARAIADVSADTRSGLAMNRLVQGDVGCGKTVVALAACYLAAKAGHQSAVMAPTDILARQHYEYMERCLAPLGIRAALVVGSSGAAERRAAAEAVSSGDALVAVGTHALISDKALFRNLALAVTDEQHRFGARQRSALAAKGGAAHSLVMSATPIPRSLALILYGDMDVSVIDELPPGRVPPKTYAVGGRYRRRALEFIRGRVDAGEQAYVVCPAALEGADGLAAVAEWTAKLAEFFAGRRVAGVWGAMKSGEKNGVMEAFAAGDIDVLVATTVVEVGVNNPNATVMLIENAERFGLSQLHQLRGRVGRGAKESWCVLISSARGETARERLSAICRTNDGFAIAEADLALRGPGDFFGLRQHGLPEFAFADPKLDTEAMALAGAFAAEAERGGDEYAELLESARVLAERIKNAAI